MSEFRVKLVDTALGLLSPDMVIINGLLVNVLTRETYQADVIIKGNRIAAVGNASDYEIGKDCVVIDAKNQYVAPGFMDAHFHIESSSITVSELAKFIVPKGITMVAEDPHEIANVFGMQGIEALYAEGRQVPLNFMLRVPGRVPALDESVETSGASLSIEETSELLDWPEALCLAGDINPQLIINKDEQQFEKYDLAISKKLTISGQSPGLAGKDLNAFIAAGAEDSHVSTSAEEVVDILRHGLKAFLTDKPNRFDREEFNKLAKMVKSNGLDTRNICIVSDDTHANQLFREGHLDYRIRMAIEEGFDPITAIQMVTINVAEHYKISRDYGSVSPGKYADIILLDNLESITVDKVIIHGELVAEKGRLTAPLPKMDYPRWIKDSIHLKKDIVADDLKILCDGDGYVEANVLNPSWPKDIIPCTLPVVDHVIMPDPANGILSVAVVERHKATGNIGKGFFKFPLKAGSFASSVNHDSHNIFVVGTNFEDMALAVNRVVENEGGYVVVNEGEVLAELATPIAGLLSEEPLRDVVKKMEAIEQFLNDLGCTISDRPFFFLNAYCLPNIPNVGMTDKGVIGSKSMKIIEVVRKN